MTMSSPNLAPFAGQRYLTLESVKRDGTPVRTPVWFAEEQGVLYVYTLANAGKVKRIRRHPRIRIAPCTMRGTVIGPWVEADATIVDATTAVHGHALLRHT
jgi:PPOX class probable F420-dependent enzyme